MRRLAGLSLALGAAAMPGAASAEEYYSLAGQIVRYSFGMTEGGSCLTCDFMSYFQLALADFSHASFRYFLSIWSILAPVMIGIWLAVRVASLMIAGGEDGRAFILSIVRRLALFAMIWSALSISTGGRSWESWAWKVTAVDYLSIVFDFAGDAQGAALTAVPSNPLYSTSATGADPFGCEGIGPQVASTANAHQGGVLKYGFLGPALELTCATERVHILGVATALAVMTSSTSAESGGWGVAALAQSFVFFFFKIFVGLCILVVYVMSAAWLIFLVLDVIVRGLIVAMLSPLFALCALFKPSRYIAIAALRQAGGAAMTALSIAIVSILSTLLMTNTVAVYNSTFEVYDQTGQYAMTRISMSEGPLVAFLEFVNRVSASEGARIPVDFSTPWFYYILMAAVSSFALGKKLISMMENMVGQQGASSLADAAQKMTGKGLQIGASLMTAGSTTVLAAGKGLGGKALGALKTKNPFTGGAAE
jgi:hypothetical protein